MFIQRSLLRAEISRYIFRPHNFCTEISPNYAMTFLLGPKSQTKAGISFASSHPAGLEINNGWPPGESFAPNARK